MILGIHKALRFLENLTGIFFLPRQKKSILAYVTVEAVTYCFVFYLV
jgi:hypothetical protein